MGAYNFPLCSSLLPSALPVLSSCGSVSCFAILDYSPLRLTALCAIALVSHIANVICKSLCACVIVSYQLLLLAPAVIRKHSINHLFPFGHVLTTVNQESQLTTAESTAGSDQWCIVELTGEDSRGGRGVYSSAGDCGSVAQWLGESFGTRRAHLKPTPAPAPDQ